MADLALRRRADPAASPALPPPSDLALEALEALTAAVLVVDAQDMVVVANPAARTLGLRGRGTALPTPLAELAKRARATRAPVEVQLTLPAPDVPPVRLRRYTRPGPPVRISVHTLETALSPDPAAAGAGFVVLVVEDLTEATRVEAVRRDFVANVSHELKTPVGALQLLAEAIADASDDPGAVRHFAARISREATRLGALVQELIDLSRLQGADPAATLAPASLDRAVAEAVDRNRLAASAKQITVAVVRDGEREVRVRGDESQLSTAVSNLLANAVAYSPERTRVIVGLRCRDDVAEVSVADEGIGIAETDQDRVFERFYRVDPARSRLTGGTGLGLAIVKHIASNHGGEVAVWSAAGAGATFTLRLPALPIDQADTTNDTGRDDA